MEQIVEKIVQRTCPVTVPEIVHVPVPVEQIITRTVPVPCERIIHKQVLPCRSIRYIPPFNFYSSRLFEEGCKNVLFPLCIAGAIPRGAGHHQDRARAAPSAGPLHRAGAPFPKKMSTGSLLVTLRRAVLCSPLFQVTQTVETCVTQDVPYPVEQIVEKIVERCVPQPYQVQVTVPVQVPQPYTVEKIIDRSVLPHPPPFFSYKSKTVTVQPFTLLSAGR